MKSKKLFLISAVTFLIFTCFLTETSVFAADDQEDATIYIQETDETIVIDDQVDVEEENDMDYEETEDTEMEDDIYIEDDRYYDSEEEPDYEEEETEE
jgi:hypothetical protein